MGDRLGAARLKLTLAALMLTMGLAAVEGNIVNTALPKIASELHGLSQLSWVLTGFMLVQSATMPLYGKISDIYGRKGLFLCAIGVFICASALCGVAQSMVQLILFRSLQGAGAAGIMTLSSATLADILPPRERSRYQGLFVGVFAISNLAGPPLGGLLITAAGWRAVFLVNVPLGLIVLAVLAAALPNTKPQVNHKVDYLGAALLVASTSSLLLTLAWGGVVFSWFSVQIFMLIAATLLLTLLLYWQETTASEPILPLHIFRDRTVTVAAITTALVAFPYFGAVVFLPLYFQVVLGMTPAGAGLMTVIQVTGFLAAAAGGGFIVAQTGRYKTFIVAGVVLQVVGMALIGVCAWIQTGPAPFLLGLAVLGLGGGASMPNYTLVVQNAVEPKDLGAATAVMTFSNTLSGAAGVALAGAILAGRLHAYVATHLPGEDVGRLLKGGLSEFSRLAEPAHHVVITAHARAVSATFLSGALILILAFVSAVSLPNAKSSRPRDPGLPAEPSRQGRLAKPNRWARRL